jgi:UDP-N-acetylmuramoyl-L-alanyl-D-glutamate--2,6-diaminopimelate ligase
MRLADVVDGWVDPGVYADLDVRDVELDSRRCAAGSLFFAMPGGAGDGAAFVDDAVARGAVAVLSASPVTTDVPSWRLAPDELHRLLVHASASVVGHPERNLTLVGVTGTNGKTSVTTTLAALWRALGHPADVIGTLTHERTTPAPPELFRELATFTTVGPEDAARLVALEVSSHALSQGRVDGLVFEVAAFTNLSLDHLDYHGTMEAYFEAKASLFTSERCRRAVVWVDDPHGARLAGSIPVPTLTVSRSEASAVRYEIGRTSFRWRNHDIVTNLSGEYNLDNALLVLAIACELGVEPAAAAGAIAEVPAVAGRFEVVSDEGPVVLVDYAHTPDGLERLLSDVRRVAGTGRVILVFGCGGDRDRTKRPIMGEVATRLADVTIVTSDNPRTESPEAIIDEIVAGCRDGATWRRVLDRRAAIAAAVGEAREADVVVLAGKGHEKTQVVGADVLEFDDRVVARELLGAGN